MSKQISKEQIQDWTENPVTEYLAELLQIELRSIKETPVTNALFYGDPQKTQENLVELEAREMAWVDFYSFLSGDWSYFEEEEEDE